MMQLEERCKIWLKKAESLAVEMDSLRDAVEGVERGFGDLTTADLDKLVPEREEAITRITQELAEFEKKETPELGVAALLKDEPEPVIRGALTMLILGSLTDRFTGRRGDVLVLSELVASSDLTDRMALRCALRNDIGVLRPLVNLDAGKGRGGLGTAWMTLKENAFNKAMGLPLDNEFENL